MAIANYNEEKPLIIYTFKKLCNGEQWLAAQQLVVFLILYSFQYLTGLKKILVANKLLIGTNLKFKGKI